MSLGISKCKIIVNLICYSVFLTVALTMLPGCFSNDKEVLTYRVAKQQYSNVSGNSDEVENPHNGQDMSVKSSDGVDPHAGLNMDSSSVEAVSNSGDFSGGGSNGTGSRFSWQAPSGWSEKSGSGMRLVSFSAGDSGQALDTSIVVLGAAASNIEANVNRWRGQVELPAISGAEILNSSEKLKTGLGDANFFRVINSAKQEDGILASMLIMSDGSVVFIKAKGAVALLEKEEENFKKLIKSLKAN